MSYDNFTTMELFAGAGGGIIASRILGHKPVIAVEQDGYCCQVLRERAADGWFPGMQVWEGDIRLYNPPKKMGKISCLNAGFPCTDLSVAGNQAGIGEGTRSGLYREILRIADVVRPEYMFLENVAAIVTGNNGGWLRTVIGDLTERGFDACWTTLSAAEVGANHERNRWWCLAKCMGNTASKGLQERRQPGRKESKAKTRTRVEPKLKRPGEDVADTESKLAGGLSKREEQKDSGLASSSQYVADTDEPQRKRDRRTKSNKQQAHNPAWRPCVYCGCVYDQGLLEKYGCPNCEGDAEPGLGGMVDDVANVLDANAWNEVEAQVGRGTAETENRAKRLRAIGNGQVPLQAAVAFSYLMEVMNNVEV